GGASSGHYLRAGAVAGRSPVVDSIREFAAKGGLVLGSCNGFQILCEAGMLPGALMRNECLQYRCQTTHLVVDNVETPFTRGLRPGQVLTMPLSHGEWKADVVAPAPAGGAARTSRATSTTAFSIDSAATRAIPSSGSFRRCGPSTAPTSTPGCSSHGCPRRARACSRARGRTPAPSTSATDGRWSSRWRATTTPR